MLLQETVIHFIAGSSSTLYCRYMLYTSLQVHAIHFISDSSHICYCRRQLFTLLQVAVVHFIAGTCYTLHCRYMLYTLFQIPVIYVIAGDSYSLYCRKVMSSNKFWLVLYKQKWCRVSFTWNWYRVILFAEFEHLHSWNMSVKLQCYRWFYFQI